MHESLHTDVGADRSPSDCEMRRHTGARLRPLEILEIQGKSKLATEGERPKANSSGECEHDASSPTSTSAI